MISISPPTPFVRKSGDVMTGDLNMTATKLVDGIDVSEIKQAKVKSGTYTGNLTDNRDIDIGVELNAKTNVYIIIQAHDGHGGVHKIDLGQGDLSSFFHTTGAFANKIQSLTATGFQIGSDVTVNEDTRVYRYVAFWEEP